LAACTLFSARRDLPLAEFDCRHALPRGYEVRATLRTSSANQDFLLAMATAPERIDLALLTAHGVPVYRLFCAEEGPRASMQTPGGDDLPPLVLLHYLALIFMDSQALAGHLRPDWVLHDQAASRVVTPPSGAAGMRIAYQGPAPWFSRIELADSLNGLTMHIEILESSRVLPE